MNACVRAVVRTAVARGVEVLGVQRGFEGLHDGDLVSLGSRAMSGLIERGGTFLGTVRYPPFADEEQVRREALDRLTARGVEGLVVIGGDGSLHGASHIELMGLPVLGVPASIDNDVWGTDLAIGVDTALNTALGAIDKIKDTASSHRRAFIVEVMGRSSGYLALTAGLASGAEMVLVPEVGVSLERIVQEIRDAYAAGKPRFIMVAAEGAPLKAETIRDYLSAQPDPAFEARLTVLGHVQRGGSPTAFDRILASRLGSEATRLLLEGHHAAMVALAGSDIAHRPLEQVLLERRKLPEELYNLAANLAR